MKTHTILSVFLLTFVPFTAAQAEDMRQGSGLPIPRFVSLKADEVNLRKGPGKRYPIAWVYRRINLPVEIVEEFGHWRKIRDAQGATGWAHGHMLKGARFVIVRGNQGTMQRLFDDPKPDASAVMKVEAGVIAHLNTCEIDWCSLSLQDQDGWILKEKLWGVYEKELYDD